MFNLFNRKTSSFKNWANSLSESSKNDIRAIDKTLNTYEPKPVVQPFFNVFADSIIYNTTQLIIPDKGKTKVEHSYYTDLSIVEISMFLLARFEASEKVYHGLKDRFILTLNKITNVDYSKIIDGRVRIYRVVPMDERMEYLLKFLMDTKVSKKINLHSTEEEFRINPQNKDFSLLRDFDIDEYLPFEIFIKTAIPKVQEELVKKAGDWFYFRFGLMS